MNSPLVVGFLAYFTLIAAIGAQNAFVLRQGIQREHVLPVVGRMWQFITRQASQPLTTRSLPQHAQGACPLAQTAQLTQYDQLHLT